MPGPDKPIHPLAQAAAEQQAKERGPITLAQFLKAVNAAQTGGHAKMLVREGQVTVNGQSEDHPGRKLAKGDVVAVDGQEFSVER